jgi:hypothetical protein
MTNKNKQIPAAAKIISIYYIVISCLFFLTIPAMISISNKVGTSITSTSFIYGILPITILNFAALISAIALLKAKNWARVSLIILSAIYIIVNLRAFFIIKLPHNPVFMTLIQILISCYAIWRLTRSDMKG